MIATGVALWFLCGLLAIHLAFGVARDHDEVFDPVHIWLAMLGPVGLALACTHFMNPSSGESLSSATNGASFHTGKGGHRIGLH